MSNVIEFKSPKTRCDRRRELPASPADEAEMCMYWRATRELRAAMAAADVQAVREWLDEIDTLAHYTANKTLRRMCGSQSAA